MAGLIASIKGKIIYSGILPRFFLMAKNLDHAISDE